MKSLQILYQTHCCLMAVSQVFALRASLLLKALFLRENIPPPPVQKLQKKAPFACKIPGPDALLVAGLVIAAQPL